MADVRIGIAAVIVAVGLRLVLTRRARPPRLARARYYAAARYLRDRDLPTDHATVPLAIRLQDARRAAGLTAVGLFTVAVGALVGLWPFLPGVTLLSAGAVPALGLLAAVSAGLTATAMRATGPAVTGPHVAHAARPGLADYVPALLRWWPAVTIAIVGACVAGYAADPEPGVVIGPGVHVAAWALGSLVVAGNLGLARRLATRPQPAASPTELALRNELTGDTIGELVAWPSLAWLPMGLPVIWPPYAFVSVLLMVVPVLAESRRRRRVRDRLWRPRVPVVET